MSTREFIKELKELKNEEHAKESQRFFKTGVGQYGYGDIFWGIRVPVLRKLVNKHKDLSLEDAHTLLQSKIHEQRFAALLVLEKHFRTANLSLKAQIYKDYVKNFKYVNNWDLIDFSVPKIMGVYLLDKDKSLLYKWVRSKNMWQRRASILATWPLIKEKRFKETFEISEILLEDSEDLLHKAVGWMLREAYKVQKKPVYEFIKKHYDKMPRTMLRYAIERFAEGQRKAILKGKF